MKNMLNNLILVLIALIFALVGCKNQNNDSDRKQQVEQEKILAEGSAQVGMPSVKNFRERKLVKDIIELRDQEGLVTYTYLYNEYTGKLVFFCDSIGYAMSAAMQFTNPQKIADSLNQGGYAILPQADPNGLFSPSSAEGSWVMCKNPNGKEVRPVYSEPRLIVAPFKMPCDLVMGCVPAQAEALPQPQTH